MRRVPGERELVVSVARRWRKQFFSGGAWYKLAHDAEVTYRKLMELDRKTATAADVAAIIGNPGWVAPEACNECEDKSWNSVRVAEDSQGDGTVLCPDCLHVALSIAGESP